MKLKIKTKTLFFTKNLLNINKLLTQKLILRQKITVEILNKLLGEHQDANSTKTKNNKISLKSQTKEDELNTLSLLSEYIEILPDFQDPSFISINSTPFCPNSKNSHNSVQKLWINKEDCFNLIRNNKSILISQKKEINDLKAQIKRLNVISKRRKTKRKIQKFKNEKKEIKQELSKEFYE